MTKDDLSSVDLRSLLVGVALELRGDHFPARQRRRLKHALEPERWLLRSIELRTANPRIGVLVMLPHNNHSDCTPIAGRGGSVVINWSAGQNVARDLYPCCSAPSRLHDLRHCNRTPSSLLIYGPCAQERPYRRRLGVPKYWHECRIFGSRIGCIWR